MKKEEQGFRIRTKSPTALVSMLAFALCIPTQLMGYIDRLNNPIIALTVVFLPIFSALLMIAVILKSDRNALRFSIFPVCIGVLGFVFKLMIDPREAGILRLISAIVLYLAIISLWALTVLYVIKTKWVLALLFLIPFFKHIFSNDLPVLLGAADPVPASTWLKEFCMLFFMLALFFCAVSFERTGDSG